jgi:hypothetical protein
MLDPYEKDNVVFIDTEFSTLDPYTGELLSVAMVTLDEQELYVELAHQGEVSAWVQQHVVPMLRGPAVSRQQAKDTICEFLGNRNPYAIGFVDNYDIIYLTKLFGAGKLPFRWMSIDFASILFAIGVNPVKFLSDQQGAKAFYRRIGIDVRAYKQHFALDDARLLRDVWKKLTSS